MFGLPENLQEYPLAIALLLIFVVIVGYMLKRDDKYRDNQNEVNKEHLKTLSLVQNDLKENREINKETAQTVKDISRALTTLKCLK